MVENIELSTSKALERKSLHWLKCNNPPYKKFLPMLRPFMATLVQLAYFSFSKFSKFGSWHANTWWESVTCLQFRRQKGLFVTVEIGCAVNWALIQIISAMYFIRNTCAALHLNLIQWLNYSIIKLMVIGLIGQSTVVCIFLIRVYFKVDNLLWIFVFF